MAQRDSHCALWRRIACAKVLLLLNYTQSLQQCNKGLLSIGIVTRLTQAVWHQSAQGQAKPGGCYEA